MMRRASHMHTDSTRTKISATLQAKSGAVPAWDESRVRRLRVLYAQGGIACVRKAFADVPGAKLEYAVRRYCHGIGTQRPKTAAPCWSSPDFNRRFMQSLSG